LLKKNPWTKSTSSWTALGWPVHGSTVDSTVVDGKGLLELGLAATLGHGGLLRGWRREGRDRGTTHQSSDDGEEVAHMRWGFGVIPRF
jgi:hypothetical protein